MSSSGTPATPAAIVQQLLASLKTDVLLNAEGLLASFFASVEKDPTLLNVNAQGAILFASALLQGPAIGAEMIVQIAKAGQALMAAAIAAQNAPAIPA